MDDILRSRLQAYCATAFPDRKNPRVTELVKLNAGWECDVYSFTLEHGIRRTPSREGLILRMYPSDEGSVKAAREFDGMDRLNKAGYPVPTVFRLETDDSPLGQPFVIMEKIEGRILGDVLRESSREAAEKLLKLVCKLFVDLHKLDWRAHVPDFELHDLRHPYSFIDREFIYFGSELTRFSKIDFLPLLGWLESRRNRVPCSRASIIHGDYHPHNILLREDGSAVVIDWTQVNISDFRFDLGWTLCLLNEHGDKAARLAVLNEYERLTGGKVEQIEFFEVAACFKRLFAMAVSLSEGPEKIGMRPEAKEAMTRNMDTVQRIYDFQREKTSLRIPEVERIMAEVY